MCPTTLARAIAAVKDTQSSETKYLDSVLALKRDVEVEPVGKNSALEILTACKIGEPPSEIFAPLISLKELCHLDGTRSYVTAQAVALDIAALAVPAICELFEAQEQRDPKQAPGNARSCTIEDVSEEKLEELDVPGVLMNIMSVHQSEAMPVPWADESTNVRATKLLQLLADSTSMRSEAGRCAPILLPCTPLLPRLSSPARLTALLSRNTTPKSNVVHTKHDRWSCHPP
jgi:hypothetical protein